MNPFNPRVYFAGPDVFREDADFYRTEAILLARERGFEGLWPDDGAGTTAGAIAGANFDLIKRSDAVIANVTPFRGPGCDPGTAVEIGFATYGGKPVFLYSQDPRDYLERVACHVGLLGNHLTRDDEDVWRDPAGMFVEDFGLADNLMVLFDQSGNARPVCGSILEAVRLAASFFEKKGDLA